ncbi:hypothetical protein AB8Z38_03080 [Bradyrhizobium sp. LLZ17]|uniref:Uncharacterized protein n=1 Tax=Bradyrhizobium sp. LLZ17 TaxID=3239388 RepID=A0AB39XKS8_9BRAD
MAILSRKPPSSPQMPPRLETSPERRAPDGLRAPLARKKLDEAIAALAALDTHVAALALDHIEGGPDAEKTLAEHRIALSAAELRVSELTRALALAERLDRQAAAAGAAQMRDEQLSAFRKAMEVRGKKMARALELLGQAAAEYGGFAEATLTAQIAVPTGTTIPQMAIGPEGAYGPAFGPASRLLLAELWRLAPERKDGLGRIVMEFAKPTSELVRMKPEAVPPGADELRLADQAILSSLEEQVQRLNERDMAAANAQREAA